MTRNVFLSGLDLPCGKFSVIILTSSLRLLLVHPKVGVDVEALEVVAGRGPGRVGHPGHSQRTGHRYLKK